jgi:hypothetical protein
VGAFVFFSPPFPMVGALVFLGFKSRTLKGAPSPKTLSKVNDSTLSRPRRSWRTSSSPNTVVATMRKMILLILTMVKQK